MPQTSIPTRAEVPVQHTWDLSSIFATPTDWETAYAQVVAQLPALQSFHGQLGASPAKLGEWFATWQALMCDVQRIIMYAQLNYSGDTNNQEAVARVGQA